MARQNRVDPFGTIHADPARGGWMGNRGRLHDDHGRLTRRSSTTRAWICCRLSFKGRHRQLMAPRRYTELFFLDEATALAAGHRPCAECRRTAFRLFQACWSDGAQRREPAPAMDSVLHAERARTRDGARTTWQAPLADLPDGVIFLVGGTRPHLWWHGQELIWSFGGYAPPRRRAAPGSRVDVLTPPCIARVLAAGYLPEVHVSAD